MERYEQWSTVVCLSSLSYACTFSHFESEICLLTISSCAGNVVGNLAKGWDLLQDSETQHNSWSVDFQRKEGSQRSSRSPVPTPLFEIRVKQMLSVVGHNAHALARITGALVIFPCKKPLGNVENNLVHIRRNFVGWEFATTSGK